MTLRPFKPCPGAGPRHGCCPHLAQRGQKYCATCQIYAKAKAAKYDKERDKGADRKFIHSRTWRKIRRMKLSKHPLCERCWAGGVVKRADLVHHKDRDELNNDMSNLESLCVQCHEAEHRGERWGK